MGGSLRKPAAEAVATAGKKVGEKIAAEVAGGGAGEAKVASKATSSSSISDKLRQSQKKASAAAAAAQSSSSSDSASKTSGAATATGEKTSSLHADPSEDGPVERAPGGGRLETDYDRALRELTSSIQTTQVKITPNDPISKVHPVLQTGGIKIDVIGSVLQYQLAHPAATSKEMATRFNLEESDVKKIRQFLAAPTPVVGKDTNLRIFAENY